MTAVTPTNYHDPERIDMHHIKLDYHDTLADFREVFADRPANFYSESPIAGINMLTDDILGVWTVNGHYVELSTGVFGETRLFGITTRPVTSLAYNANDDYSRLIDPDKASSMEDVRAEFDKLVAEISR